MNSQREAPPKKQQGGGEGRLSIVSSGTSAYTLQGESWIWVFELSLRRPGSSYYDRDFSGCFWQVKGSGDVSGSFRVSRSLRGTGILVSRLRVASYERNCPENLVFCKISKLAKN